MSQTGAGWYPDPQDPRIMRWWDGARWTPHSRPAAQQPQRQYPGVSRFQPTGYPTPPPRRGNGGAVVAVILVLALVLTGGAVYAVYSWIDDVVTTAGGGGGGGTQTSPAGGTQTSPGGTAMTVYYINERPEWAPMQEYVDSTHQRYADALADGSIYEFVENTDAGYEYARSFVLILADVKGALRFSGGTSSTMPGELDAQIQAWRDKVAEYERRFLAGEDLGVSIRIVNADGTVFESDGVAPEMMATDPESFAQAFVPSPDASGSYLPAAEELAAAFGMELTFDYQSIYDNCTASGSTLENIEASFCSGTPELIYMNTDFWGYPDNFTGSAVIDTIRHEIGHRRIYDICGSSAPPITVGIHEGVTNSYAVLYLGADEATLGTDLNSTYAITAQTYEIAEAIHNGQCT